MSANQDIESLLSLLKVAEELLFSFPLPEEVTSKYEFIRAKTFTKCQLPYNGSFIRRLQIEAQSKLDKESSKVINTSALDLKDLDLQNKIQQSSILTQKLLSLIDKNLKIHAQCVKNCQILIDVDDALKYPGNHMKFSDTSTRPYEMSDADAETMYETYKKAVGQHEQMILKTLQDLQENIKTKIAYIKKLELDAHGNNSDLSQINSEITEKYKLLQDRYIKDKNEYELKIKEIREELLFCKTSSLNDARKVQNREVERLIQERDMYMEESDNLRSKLNSTTEALQNEIKSLREEYENSTQEITQTLNYKIIEIESTLQSKIDELEKKLFYRESDLLREIEDKTSHYNNKTQDLEKDLNFYKNNSEAAHRVLDIIQDVLDRVYKKYSEKAENLGDLSSTLIHQIQFLDRIITKLSTDNAWLVDRLSETGRDNEELKKSLKDKTVKEALDDLSASASVMKNFEVSRQKLKQRLSESVIQFPDVYSKLAYKYNN